MSDVKFTIQCEMDEAWVDQFCSFLDLMQEFGIVGHSETIGFMSDGDGTFRPSFEFSRPWNTVFPKKLELDSYVDLDSWSMKYYDAG